MGSKPQPWWQKREAESSCSHSYANTKQRSKLELWPEDTVLKPVPVVHFLHQAAPPTCPQTESSTKDKALSPGVTLLIQTPQSLRFHLLFTSEACVLALRWKYPSQYWSYCSALPHILKNDNYYNPYLPFKCFALYLFPSAAAGSPSEGSWARY